MTSRNKLLKNNNSTYYSQGRELVVNCNLTGGQIERFDYLIISISN